MTPKIGFEMASSVIRRDPSASPENKGRATDPAKPRNLKITYQIAFGAVKENTGSPGASRRRIMTP
jgi:hypothetical protein